MHDDRTLFEFLVLEGAQAGLSWETILRKREGYRRAFCGFDLERAARMTDADLERLRGETGIVRNRLKIRSVRANAAAFLKIRDEFGSFDDYLWSFVNGRPIIGCRDSLQDVPVRSPVSDALSKDLKSRGMSFVGSTLMYAYMQAVGMADDHVSWCWRRNPAAARH